MQTLVKELEQQLIGLFGQTDLESLNNYYKISKPERWETRLPEKPSSILEFTHDLARAPLGNNHQYPLVNYLYRIKELIAEPDQSKWLEILRTELKKFNILLPENEQPSKLLFSVSTKWAYLSIQIDWQNKKESLYKISCWLNIGVKTIRMTSELKCKSHDLPTILSDLRLKVINEHRIPPSILFFEFFLPNDLLYIKCDLWTYIKPLSNEKCPVSCEHPMVIRSLDRFKYNEIFQQLEKRWGFCDVSQQSKLLENEHPTNCNELNLILTIKEENFPNLDALLLTERGKQIVGSVFDIAIDQITSSHKTVILTLIERGIPLIIWSRTSSPEVEIASRLLEIIESTPLNKLPECFSQLRNEARLSQGLPLRQSITLLWDDPTRLPPGFTLSNQYQ